MNQQILFEFNENKYERLLGKPMDVNGQLIQNFLFTPYINSKLFSSCNIHFI